MADRPLPNAWLFEALDTLRREQAEQHARLRSDMSRHMDQFRGELRQVSEELDKISRDVLTIQIQRTEQDKQAANDEKKALRRSTSAAMVTSMAFTALLKLIEALLPHR